MRSSRCASMANLTDGRDGDLQDRLFHLALQVAMAV